MIWLKIINPIGTSIWLADWPCDQLPPPKKKNVVTVSQLMHRWIGLAGSGTGEVVCFLKWQKILVVTCHPSGFHVSIAGNIRAVHLCIFFTG